MQEKKAIIASDAMAENDHDFFIYKSEASQEKVKWLDNYLKDFLEPDKTIIELGCGSGKHLFKIEEWGLQTIGLEISKEMIKRIERNKHETNSEIKIIEGSYYNIPLENASVDYVLFPLNIVENSCEEYEIICKEARRILKRGGRYFMTMKEHAGDIIEGRNKHADKYNILAGNFDTRISTPSRENIEYPTYYWTVAFEHYIAEKYLRFEKIREMREGEFLIVYSKGAK
jgi:ubiquinone/menaquinone biosynthesis C-methylase UbiE